MDLGLFSWPSWIFRYKMSKSQCTWLR